LAGAIVVLCVGMVIGGAIVYGVSQVGGILPDLAARFRDSRVDRFYEEPQVIERADELPAPGERAGAYVVRVEANSPAEDAGLQAGDQLLAVDGQDVGVDGNLAELIAGNRPGDRVTLEIQRPGEGLMEIRVRLGEHPDDADQAWLGIRYSQTRAFAPLEGELPPFGRFRQLDPERFEEMFPGPERLQGVVIRGVAEDSPAATAGLEPGDAILALDGEAVGTPAELSQALAAHQPGDRITLTVMSMGDGQQREVEVRLAEHPDKPDAGYLGVFLGGGFRFERRGLPEGSQGWNFDFDSIPFSFDLPFDGEGDDGWFQFNLPQLEDDSL
jgi:membrane-associated protease RseP (regulator of RpoE activity)